MENTSKIVIIEIHCNEVHEKQWHNRKEEHGIGSYRPSIIASRQW